MVRGVRIKDHWAEQRLFARRSLWAGLAIVVLTLALAGRLYVLQVLHHQYYSQLSEGNRIRVEPVPAARGRIYDRNGVLLATGQPEFQLELIRDEVPNLHQTLERLVRLGLIHQQDLPQIRRNIFSRRSFDSVPIRLRMSDRAAARFAVHRWEFPGVDIKSREGRYYPFGPIGVDAIGYVGAISEQDLKHIDQAQYAGTSLIGKTGVEASYEKLLHGTNGYRDILVDAQGRRVRKMGKLTLDLKHKAPIPGDDLILSLDMRIQEVAEQALGNHAGAVVAIDPRDGDVLVLASHPSYDPNLFARGITQAEYTALVDDPAKPLLDRALRGEFPSGSTIKPTIALAALADHAVNPNHKVFCNGVFRLPGSAHRFREDAGGPHGWIALQEAISRSSDIYFYTLAAKLGITRLDAGLKRFGVGQPTGIDIPGEQAGLLPTPAWKRKNFKNPAEQVWFPGETVILGIGQGYLLVTPLQLAHIASMLADRGKNFRPRLVRGIRYPNGHVHWVPPVQGPPVVGNTAANWKLVINGMIGTTHCTTYCGTAWQSFKGAAYVAAGKTGTAQVYTVAQNAHYDAKTTPWRLRDNAWFIAFAPAARPVIAVAVLVEHAGFGAQSAAPIARKVLDAYLLGPNGKLKPRYVPPKPGLSSASTQRHRRPAAAPLASTAAPVMANPAALAGFASSAAPVGASP